MLFYILRRLVSALSVVIVTLIASFALFFLAPTDPAGVICGPRCTPERLHDIETSLSLDKPAVVQIAQYMKSIVVGRDYTTGGVTRHCDAPCLGYSYTLGQPVTKLLMAALPVTLSIVIGGAIIYFTVGVFTGTL
jgi:peptide/nickel transport system permease protein